MKEKIVSIALFNADNALIPWHNESMSKKSSEYPG
jgi:hypothetical protein